MVSSRSSSSSWRAAATWETAQRAHRDDEEAEREPDVGSRCQRRAGPEFGQRVAKRLRDPDRGDALGDHAEVEANAPRCPSMPPGRRARWRSACAVGEDSSRRRGVAVSRAGAARVPRSRWAAIRAATTSSAPLAATGSASTAGRAPVNGRSFSSAHPSGGRPPQPAGTAGGVGDHAQQPAQSHQCARQRERDPAASRRADWGHRADAGDTGTTDAVARAR